MAKKDKNKMVEGDAIEKTAEVSTQPKKTEKKYTVNIGDKRFIVIADSVKDAQAAAEKLSNKIIKK